MEAATGLSMHAACFIIVSGVLISVATPYVIAKTIIVPALELPAQAKEVVKSTPMALAADCIDRVSKVVPEGREAFRIDSRSTGHRGKDFNVHGFIDTGRIANQYFQCWYDEAGEYEWAAIDAKSMDLKIHLNALRDFGMRLAKD